MNAEMIENIHTEIKSQLMKLFVYANAKYIDGMLEIYIDEAPQIKKQGKIETQDKIKAVCTGFIAPSQSFLYYLLLDL